MIDFQNASYAKLGRIDYSVVASQIDPLLIEGEEGYMAFKGMRDYIVFTSKRIIAVNVQGMTGKKKDYTSLPFARVNEKAYRPPLALTDPVGRASEPTVAQRAVMSTMPRHISSVVPSPQAT